MTNTTFKQAIVAFPGIGISLLPKLMCPACWPAYAGLMSSLGLGLLVSSKYLLPLTVAFLAITTFILGFRAPRRYGYGPLWVGILAAAIILTGKFYFDSEQATYAGVGVLVAASVWNSWPLRAAVVPSCCDQAGASVIRRDLEGEHIHETHN